MRNNAPDRQPGLLQRLGWSRRDAVGCIVGVFATVSILVNVLYLQSGSHPAPLVRSGVVAAAPAPILTGTSTSVPRSAPRDATPKADLVKAAPAPDPAPAATPPAPAPSATTARGNAATVAEIQRELTRRGFYDGTVDGRNGRRTEVAIREFEQAAGLQRSAEPTDALLRSIQRSPLRSRPVAAGARPQAPAARPDPIANLISPSRQVIAVQRALSEFGYGQITPTGVIDPATQSAIQRFERERNLPVTGQLSHRVVRELASITGRPLE